MSKKDYIVIAEGIINSIQLGYVKKQNIDDTIRVMSNVLIRDNYEFDGTIFKNYILERV